MSTFLESLAGPETSEAGGLAALTTGAAGAALYLKCRYQPARSVMEELKSLAKTDGEYFARYQHAKRDGEPVEPALQAATSSPLRGAEFCLQLVAKHGQAKNSCPKSMLSDLSVGHTLLLAAAKSCHILALANLECFPEPWTEGEAKCEKLRTQIDCYFGFQ